MIYRGGTVIAPCWGEMGRYLGYRNIFKIQRSAELSSTLSIEFVNFFASMLERVEIFFPRLSPSFGNSTRCIRPFFFVPAVRY